MGEDKKRRTSDELNDVEYNYFRYYGIKPSEKDPNAISTIIKKKASDTNPKYPRLARDLKDDAEQILVNDAIFDGTSYVPNSGGRKKEAEALKRLVLNRAKNYVQNSSKGRKIIFYSLIQKITDSPENLIAGENIFTFDELLGEVKYLESSGFQFIDENRADPFASFEGMDQYFVTVNCKDLYGFLGLTKDVNGVQMPDLNASDKDITQALATKKAEWAKLPTSDRNRKNAYSKLNGKVPLILQKPDQRKLYNYFISYYDAIWSKFKEKKTYNDFDLEFDEFTRYVSIISNNEKIDTIKAREILVMGLHHYSLNLVGGNEGDELDTCPHCGKLYSKDKKVCPHCGTNLVELCWNCSEPIPISSRVCPCCGVSVNLKTNFDQAKANMDMALMAVPIDEVKLDAALLSLKNVYSKYDKKPDCQIAKTIAGYLPRIEKRKSEKKKIDQIFNDYIVKVMDLCARKSFFQASSVLAQAKSKLPTYDFKKYETQINSAISSARSHVQLAQNKFRMNDKEGGLTEAGNALTICCDYTEALNLLKANPPSTPTGFQVLGDKDGAHLKWNPLPNKNITYSIIRKTGVLPKADDDGSLIAENLTLTEFIDSSLVSGVPTYYAVFANRLGIHSNISVFAKPALIFLNVSNVHQEIKDNAIRVVFRKPEGCKNVLIVKKEGSIAPNSLNDGEKVEVKENVFEINDCKSDVYSFYIVTEYLVNGKKEYSAPLKATYRKTSLPKPLKIVSTESKGNQSQFIIQYEELGSNFDIELYTADKCYDFEFDTPDENIHFQQKYKNLSKASFIPGDKKIIYDMEPNKIVWLYPVVKNADLYVISKPVMANSIVGIEAINVLAKEGSVTIEGNVHRNTRNIIALISANDFPSSLDDKDKGIQRKSISKQEFDRAKGFKMNLTPGKYFITLFFEFVENSQTFYSAPTKLPFAINCQKKTPLKCAFEGDIDLYHKKKIKVCFKSEIQGTVPDCEIYVGFPRPQSKASGMMLAQVPGGQLKKKLFKQDYYYTAIVEVPPLPKKEDKIAIFFSEKDSDEFYIQVVDKI